MIKNIWRTLLFLIYYCTFLVNLPALAETDRKTQPVHIDFNDPRLLSMTALNSALMLIFGMLLCKERNYKLLLKTLSGGLFLFCTCLLVCLLIMNFLFSLAAEIFSWPIQVQISAKLLRSSYFPTALLCLLIGYSEETLFRKAAEDIFPFIRTSWAHITMSLLFGLAHSGQGPAARLFSTAAGGMFAFSYIFLSRKYNTVTAWHGIAWVHGAYNFIMIILAGRL